MSVPRAPRRKGRSSELPPCPRRRSHLRLLICFSMESYIKILILYYVQLSFGVEFQNRNQRVGFAHCAKYVLRLGNSGGSPAP